MKKIILGLLIVASLCVTLFAEPTEEDLVKYGIDPQQYGSNGNTYYIYSEQPELKKGKSYMCLSEIKDTNLKIEDGMANVVLFEVGKEGDADVVECNGYYIKYYPTGYLWIADTDIELGKVIVFDSIETLFGKNWVETQSWYGDGWMREHPELKIPVSHKFYENNMITKEAFDKADVEVTTKSDGTKYSYYKTPLALETGKKYMCLDKNKEKNIQRNKDNEYEVYFYEIVTKSHPNAYKVGSKYITSYPIAAVSLQVEKDIKIPSEITFNGEINYRGLGDGEIKSLFGKNWDIRYVLSWYGYGAVDSDLGVVVRKHFNQYYLYESGYRPKKEPSAPKYTKEELAPYGIDIVNDDNGEFWYAYTVAEPEKGKRYMVLNIEKETELKEKDGFYEVGLYEVVEEEEDESYKAFDTFIRRYPSVVYRIPDSTVELGKIITFDSAENLFGKGNSAVDNGGMSRWSKKNSELDISVYFHVKRYLIVTEEMRAKKGVVVSSDGIHLLYSPVDLEKGKRYMCLNGKKEKNITENEEGVYEVTFYEIVDKNYPNAYKVGSKYIKEYPNIVLKFKFKKSTKIPDEIKFTELESLFGKKWKVGATKAISTGFSEIDKEWGVRIWHEWLHKEMIEE